MTTIALFGAGGKMGVRLAKNLVGSAFEVRHVEPGAAGRQRLKDETGLDCVAADVALKGADVVILAVPDTLIGRLAAEIAPQLPAGTMVMTLDAAAPFAGHLPARPDLVYFVAHPCHPSIFSPEVHVAGAPDYFGGVSAPQSVVSALMQGPDAAFDLGEAIAKTIYAPILRSYRVTVEQMALLEPGLSETVGATLLDVMREAMDEVVARGVPADCARDFLLGHMSILSAVIFKQIPGQFSDACNKAITFGKPRLMRDDWKKNGCSSATRSPRASAASPEPSEDTTKTIPQETCTMFRSTLSRLAALAALSVAGLSPVAAQTALKIGYAPPKDSHYGVGATVLCDEIAKGTANRYTCQHFPSSALGGEREMIEAVQLGILPTPMPFPELFTALQQGTVDGQENPIPVILSSRFSQVQKYLSLTSHVYPPAVFILSPEVWDKLSDADKKVFAEAALKAGAAQRKRVNDDENTGIAQLKKDGMQVDEKVDGDSFRKAVAPAYAEFAKEFGADKIAAIQAVK